MIAPVGYVALVAWATVALSCTRGSTLYIDYQANPSATVAAGVHEPARYGWVNNFSAGAGAGLINDAGLGVNAWQVTDATAQFPTPQNPGYVTALGSSNASLAATQGFRFEAYARYATDYGGGASLGLTVFLNQRAYHLMFDLNAAGDLQATLYNRPGGPTVLTSGGTGSAAYHRISLESRGGPSVTATFDGQPIGAAWTGATSGAHADIFLWGNSNQAINGRGVMSFAEVRVELGPFNDVAGDFDGDQDVDAGDLLTWQQSLGMKGLAGADANRDGRVNFQDLAVWRGAFGAQLVAATAGPVIPEPPATIIAIALIVAWAVVSFRTVGSRSVLAARRRRPSTGGATRAIVRQPAGVDP